jgi:hypothetical protein
MAKLNKSLKRRFERKDAYRFNALEVARATVSPTGRLRYSRIVAQLSPAGQAEAEEERKKAAHCPVHGELTDPAIFLHGEGAERRVVFVCPECSGPEVLEAWKQEGAS